MTDAQNEVHAIAAIYYTICNHHIDKRNRIVNYVANYGQRLAQKTRDSLLVRYTNRRNVANQRLLTSTFIDKPVEKLCGKQPVGPGICPTEVPGRQRNLGVPQEMERMEGYEKGARMLTTDKPVEKLCGKQPAGKGIHPTEDPGRQRNLAVAQEMERIESSEKGARMLTTLPLAMMGTAKQPVVRRKVKHTENSNQHKLPMGNKTFQAIGGTQENLAAVQEGTRKAHPVKLTKNSDQQKLPMGNERIQSTGHTQENLGAAQEGTRKTHPAKDTGNSNQQKLPMGNETFKATGETQENLAAAQEGARKAHSEREIEGHTLKQGMGAGKPNKTISQRTTVLIEPLHNKKVNNKRKLSLPDESVSDGEQEATDINEGPGEININKEQDIISIDEEPEEMEEHENETMEEERMEKREVMAADNLEQPKFDQPRLSQRKRQKIEIPKHLFTIMSTKLRENQPDKDSDEIESIPADNRKDKTKAAKIYGHVPEKLKARCRIPLDITDTQRSLFESKTRRRSNGQYKCLLCGYDNFIKQYEAMRHVRVKHYDIPLYMCAFGNCHVSSSNTKSLGTHTVFSHFSNVFKNVKI